VKLSNKDLEINELDKNIVFDRTRRLIYVDNITYDKVWFFVFLREVWFLLICLDF